MARWSKKGAARPTPQPALEITPAAAPGPDPVAMQVARSSLAPVPEPDPAQADRRAALSKLTVRAKDPELAGAVQEAAVRVRCLMPGKEGESDRKATGQIARFLLWFSSGGVIDEGRAFRRSNVDEYLIQTRTRSENSFREARYVLYGAGRVLHPREYPPPRKLSAPRSKGLPATSVRHIRELQALIPGLPTLLGMRVQTLLDLTYGAGARASDFKSLRGTAITTTSFDGRAVAVVTLPNNGGGVRQVPVLDHQIAARLIVRAATVGNNLVLSSTAENTDRNMVNRVNEKLRARDLPSMDPAALRNRWIIDLAERIPAALLLQLADIGDLRVLADHRKQLPQYTIRHAITILAEVCK